MSAQTARTPDDQPVGRQVAYTRILQTIENQTGGNLGATVTDRTLRTVTIAHGELTVDEYRNAVRAAIENHDVARWDTEYVRATPDRVRAAIVEEAHQDDPNQNKVGFLNTVHTTVVDETGGDGQ